jgi:uncharacterized protein YgiM (DUF1202 family)
MKQFIPLIFLFLSSVTYGATYKVMGEPHLNVRSSPSSQSRIIGKVEYGETVKSISIASNITTVSGKRGKWVKIRYSNKGTGYVFDAFLREITTENSLYTVIAEPHLNVRSSPDLHSSIVGQVDYGDAVRVRDIVSESENISGKRGRWVKIQYDGDDFGYAFDAFLAKSSHNTKSFKMYSKGNTQYRKGNYYHAVKYYHSALEHTTNEVEIIKVLGALSQVSKKEGNLELAKEYARKIMELDPTNEFANNIVSYSRPKRSASTISYIRNNKSKCERRTEICLALTWGPDACSTGFNKYAEKELDTNVHDIIASPACLATISEALGQDYSGEDLGVAMITGALDEAGKAGVNSEDFFSKVLGVMAYIGSHGIKYNLYKKCMNQCI